MIMVVMIMMMIVIVSSNDDDRRNDHENTIVSTVRLCYEKLAEKRTGNRTAINTKYTHRPGDSLVMLEDAVDDIDLAQMITLSDCIKTVDPSRFEDRKFNNNGFKNKYGGGHDVIFLTGLMPLIIPTLTDHLITVAANAAEKAGWRPSVHHLGIRCIEKLVYHPGGELLYHVDGGSTYTLVIMVSNKNDYTGGDFQIINKSGTVISRNASKRGGVLFDSNKDHGVTPIITGSRHVFAVEFWPFYDTNIDDKRPREVDYADRGVKFPQLIEVEVENNQKSCSVK